ncbi:hypothetical protein B7494_g626 [Chlorociboria aeruginascens]|nr:hypothetical protein B7494_g626 [Chlorociboria aeruginascens]
MAQGRPRRRRPRRNISINPSFSPANDTGSKTESDSVDAVSHSTFQPIPDIDFSVLRAIVLPGGEKVLVTEPSGRKFVLPYSAFTKDDGHGGRFVPTALPVVPEIPSLVTSNELADSKREGNQKVADSSVAEARQIHVHPTDITIPLHRLTVADIAAIAKLMEDHGITITPPGSPHMAQSNLSSLGDSRLEFGSATPTGSQYGFSDTANLHGILNDPSYPVASEILRPSSRVSYQGGSHFDYPEYASFRDSNYSSSPGRNLWGNQYCRHGSTYGNRHESYYQDSAFCGEHPGSPGNWSGSRYLGPAFTGKRQGSPYNSDTDFNSYTSSKGRSTSGTRVPAIIRVRREAANILIDRYKEELKKRFPEHAKWGTTASEWEERNQQLTEKIRNLEVSLRGADKGKERAGEEEIKTWEEMVEMMTELIEGDRTR